MVGSEKHLRTGTEQVAKNNVLSRPLSKKRSGAEAKQSTMNSQQKDSSTGPLRGKGMKRVHVVYQKYIHTAEGRTSAVCL